MFRSRDMRRILPLQSAVGGTSCPNKPPRSGFLPVQNTRRASAPDDGRDRKANRTSCEYPPAHAGPGRSGSTVLLHERPREPHQSTDAAIKGPKSLVLRLAAM